MSTAEEKRKKKADYQRQWRARHGAKTGQPGRPATAPHGTRSAYQRHKRAGETPCAACRKAETDYQAEAYQRRKAK